MQTSSGRQRGQGPSTYLFCTWLALSSLSLAVNAGSTITVGGDGDYSTIQAALNNVVAGDTIEISEGQYFEDIQTMVDGTEFAKIIVRGAPGSRREDVVLRGAGYKARMVEIKHDHYTVKDFTIDGEAIADPDDDVDFKDAYRDIALYALADRAPTMRDGGYLSTLDGLIVTNMLLQNLGGECIRLRYFVTHADIYNNEILNCGVYAFVFGDGGKSGEGVYIGTSSNQWDDGKNFSDEPDQCRENLVRNNIIKTMGNEGIDIKDGSVDNIIEDNEIYVQLDEDSGGINSRGDGSIIRNNYIQDASGAGVRLGGREVDDIQYGVNNQVYGNVLVNCKAYGVKIMASPQGIICGNDITPPSDVDPENYKFSGGTYDDEYPYPTLDCDPAQLPPTLPTPSSISPTPAPNESTVGTYKGCFKDKRGARTMKFGYQDTEDMNNQDCIKFCRDEMGARFAATSRGKSCRCSSDEDGIRSYGESNERCSMPCPGDESDTCGGWLYLTVYEV